MRTSVARAVEREPGFLHLVVGSAPAVLSHPVHLGAGVNVVVDPVRPSHWLELSAPAVTEFSAPILAALLGPAAVDELRGGAGSVAPAPVDAGPWLRLAALDALDRWLHLP